MKTLLSTLAVALLLGCSTLPIPTPPPADQAVAAADNSVRTGHDALNILAKWQEGHRANLKENPALSKDLKARKSGLWKAMNNTRSRRDAYVKKPSPELEGRLSAATAELVKQINDAVAFADKHTEKRR